MLTHFKVEEKEMTDSVFWGWWYRFGCGKNRELSSDSFCFLNASVLKGGMEGRGEILRKRYKAATTGSFWNNIAMVEVVSCEFMTITGLPGYVIFFNSPLLCCHHGEN